VDVKIRGFAFRSLALVAAAISVTATRAPAQTEFKTFTIIVGFGAGGGYDLYARMLARHMGQFLPGQPKVIVQNMLGGGSLKAVEYLDTGAPQDGTVIVEFSPGMIVESVVNPEKIQFKFSDVAWIGSITRDLRACYAWGATGIESMADLKKAKQFNMGAPAPGSSNYLNAAVLKSMFGIAVHHVNGYPTSSAQRLAIERGELDGDCGAWSSVPADWLRDHKINPIVSFSSVPVPGLEPGVPFVRDLAPTSEDKAVLDLLLAPDALGRPFVASKRVPAERLAAVRAAFDATVTDQQFLAEAATMQYQVAGPVGGAEAERMVAAVYTAQPSLIARAQAIIGP
jgi:tripartite-type tricarboxylate transporter receptor subunit TctC